MRNWTLLTLALGLSACGGSLKHTIDDNTVASTSMEERGAINAARNEGTIADDELRSAQAQERNVESALDLAENEYKSAKLAKESAKLNREAAAQSGDFNRKNKAEREFTAADKQKDAADAKVDWLGKKKKWAKRVREAAEAHVDVVKSHVELEKAKLCQMKNIRPSEKFNVMDYEQQYTEKQTKYNDARRECDEKKTDVDDRERRYQTAQQSADAAKVAASSP